jgi:hypothetical protein
MRKVLFTLTIAGGFLSFKKTDTAASNPCSVTAANIAGKYKISAVSYQTSAAAAAVDLLANMQDCEKDNTYEFKADGTMAVSDAGISCGSQRSPENQSRWVLKNNNSTLRLSDAALTIEHFNCSKLVITQSGVSIPGDKNTITYTKQP